MADRRKRRIYRIPKGVQGAGQFTSREVWESIQLALKPPKPAKLTQTERLRQEVERYFYRPKVRKKIIKRIHEESGTISIDHDYQVRTDNRLVTKSGLLRMWQSIVKVFGRTHAQTPYVVGIIYKDEIGRWRDPSLRGKFKSLDMRVGQRIIDAYLSKSEDLKAAAMSARGLVIKFMMSQDPKWDGL